MAVSPADSLMGLRAALILYGVASFWLLLACILVVGAITGRIDVLDMFVDGRTGKVTARLVFEWGMFGTANGVLLIAAVRNYPSLDLLAIGIVSAYAARSVLGPFVMAKTGSVMSGYQPGRGSYTPQRGGQSTDCPPSAARGSTVQETPEK